MWLVLLHLILGQVGDLGVYQGDLTRLQKESHSGCPVAS